MPAGPASRRPRRRLGRDLSMSTWSPCSAACVTDILRRWGARSLALTARSGVLGFIVLSSYSANTGLCRYVDMSICQYFSLDCQCGEARKGVHALFEVV